MNLNPNAIEYIEREWAFPENERRYHWVKSQRDRRIIVDDPDRRGVAV